MNIDTYTQKEYSVINYETPISMEYYDDNSLGGDQLSFETRSPRRMTLSANLTYGSFDDDYTNAMNFDGSTEIEILDLDSLPIGNDPYTISVWIKPTSVINNGGIVGWGTCIDDANSCNGIRLQTNAQSEIEVVNFWNANDLIVIPHSSYFGLDAWHHIAAVFTKSGELSIYVNSRLLGTDNHGSSHSVTTDAFIGVFMRTNILMEK